MHEEARESVTPAAIATAPVRAAAPGKPKHSRAEPEAAETAEPTEPTEPVRETGQDVFSIIEELEKQLQTTIGANDALDQQLQATRREQQALAESVAAGIGNVDALEEELADLETLREEAEFAQRGRNEDKERIKGLKQKRLDLKEQLRALTGARNEVSESLQALLAVNTAARQEIAELKDSPVTLERVRHECETLKESRGLAFQREDGVRTLIEEAKLAAKRARREEKAAERGVKRFETANARQEKMRDDLLGRRSDLRVRSAFLREENETLTAKIRRLQEAIASTLAENRHLANELRDSRQAIGQVRSSLTGTMGRVREGG